MDDLNVVECRSCGAIYWAAIERGGLIASGPCCRGLEVVSFDRYPTLIEARRAWPGYIKRREASIKAAQHAVEGC